MKHRGLWIFVIAAALVLAAVWWWLTPAPSTKPPPSSAVARPVAPTAPAEPSPVVRFQLPAPKPREISPAPPPVVPVAPETTAKPKPDVAIEDGKTIDFSSGVPVVKDDAQEKAAIDRSVKAMEEAAKKVTFGPPPAATTKATAAEPAKK